MHTVEEKEETIQALLEDSETETTKFKATLTLEQQIGFDSVLGDLLSLNREQAYHDGLLAGWDAAIKSQTINHNKLHKMIAEYGFADEYPDLTGDQLDIVLDTLCSLCTSTAEYYQDWYYNPSNCASDKSFASWLRTKTDIWIDEQKNKWHTHMHDLCDNVHFVIVKIAEKIISTDRPIPVDDLAILMIGDDDPDCLQEEIEKHVINLLTNYYSCDESENNLQQQDSTI